MVLVGYETESSGCN